MRLPDLERGEDVACNTRRCPASEVASAHDSDDQLNWISCTIAAEFCSCTIDRQIEVVWSNDDTSQLLSDPEE